MGNNGHGRFTSADARRYVAAVQDNAASSSEFHDSFETATNRLRDVLGDSFVEFWDSYPVEMTKREFLPIMLAKIAAVEREMCVLQEEWLDTYETLLSEMRGA
jgi:hypothetical protein